MATRDGRCDCDIPDLDDGRCAKCGRRAGPSAKQRVRDLKEARRRVRDTKSRHDLDLDI